MTMAEPVGGRFGEFGGRFVPETLVPACEELEAAFRSAWADDDFRGELNQLLADFVVQALYDIENDRFGTLFLDGRAYPFEGVWARFGFGLDTHAGKVDEGLFEVGWHDDRGDALRVVR